MTPNLIQRYNYTPLSRSQENNERKYLTPDGTKVPSVTTILSATQPPEKAQALANWRKGVGEAKANAIMTEASSRGTRMHSYLEKYVLTGELPVAGSNPYSKQARTMAEQIVLHGMTKCSEIWGTEVPLYYPQVYAGTSDCVAVHDGKPAILDFKQTNKPKKREMIDDYFLQLAFYATAHNELYNTNIDRGVILMCSADFQYQEFIVDGSEWSKYVDMMWRRLEEFYVKQTVDFVHVEQS